MIKIITLFLFSFQAFAYCPSIDIENLPPSFDFANDLTPRFSFRVTRDDRSESCIFAIGIDKGGAANYNRQLSGASGILNYNLSPEASINNIFKDVNDRTNNNEIILGEFRSNRGNSSQNTRFYGQLTLPNNATGGHYTDTVNVKVYELFFGFFYILRQTKPLTLYYQVPEQIALSIVNRGASFDSNSTSRSLNFGSLSAGATRGVDVVIQTSAGYSLNVSSQNNGKMKHSQINSYVDYSLRANGQPVNLDGSSSSPRTIQTGTGGHPGDGFRFELDFEIGAVNTQPAGNYNDLITVTVTTNL